MKKCKLLVPTCTIVFLICLLCFSASAQKNLAQNNGQKCDDLIIRVEEDNHVIISGRSMAESCDGKIIIEGRSAEQIEEIAAMMETNTELTHSQEVEMDPNIMCDDMDMKPSGHGQDAGDYHWCPIDRYIECLMGGGEGEWHGGWQEEPQPSCMWEMEYGDTQERLQEGVEAEALSQCNWFLEFWASRECDDGCEEVDKQVQPCKITDYSCHIDEGISGDEYYCVIVCEATAEGHVAMDCEPM